jgi:hypothetical protein
MEEKDKYESMGVPIPHVNDDSTANLIRNWRRQAERFFAVVGSDRVTVTDHASVQIIGPGGIPSQEAVGEPTVMSYPEVLLQTEIILTGDRTHEGILVQGVTVAWEEIIRRLAQDPEFLSKIDWRRSTGANLKSSSLVLMSVKDGQRWSSPLGAVTREEMLLPRELILAQYASMIK